MTAERPIEKITGLAAVTQNAMPFVMLMGNGVVIPMYGATIVKIGEGKFLARLFTGERWIEEVLEIRNMEGAPTLVAAAN